MGLFFPEICVWLRIRGMAVFVIEPSEISGRMALQSWLVLLASQEGFPLLSKQTFQGFHQLGCLSHWRLPEAQC